MAPVGPPSPLAAAPPVKLSPWAAPGSPAAAPAPASADGTDPTVAGPSAGYAGPVVDLLAAGEPTVGDGVAEAPAARRRPDLVLVLSAALVVGVLLGGALGYGIQAQRPPTPLPSLQVARPGYPAAVADAKAVADAAPQPLSIDGDLRKLVIGRPDGTEAWDRTLTDPSWLTIGDIADRSGGADEEFVRLSHGGFRRAAGVEWQKGGTKYRVTLTQFGPDSVTGATLRANDAGADLPFADGANGGVRTETEPTNWAESTETYYYGYAHARRGTVVMEIEVFAPQQVDAGELKDLAKKQWERLA
ncbi:hypothetical protein [Kitasatospora sp. NBC_00315]|uniref:hypothetical protein n=1 Tax=Kitasatospora sp. NBC_00315 TaxID=2975963 RepID=UPI0032535825